MGTEQEKKLRQKESNLKKTEQLKRRAERTLSKSKPKQQVKTDHNSENSYTDSNSRHSDKKLYFYCFLAISLALIAASGPPLVLQDITQAAYESNSKRLEKRIDYDTLRANVASQLTGHVKGLPDQNMVDELMEPENFCKIVSSSDEMNSPPSMSYYLKNVRYSIESLNKVKATVMNGEKRQSTLILRFSGFSWKLVNIIIPENQTI